ncbi:TadE/TadG family type IV pilus assembly protein [Streptomyces sp. NPDC001544]|uniref:TadE/TadG family type IV pilus assembly protein n=1 Tax=Streptomyces sp. NPDC001544 TaxID=3364584 RepID=UPI0036ADB577
MRYRRERRRDQGQVAIEYLGFVPILLLVGMAGLQIGVVAYAAEQAGTAARAGARAASLQLGTAQQACREAVSGGLDVQCGEEPQGDSVKVTANVHIPSIVPFWKFGTAQKTATMPLDHPAQGAPAP